MKMIVHWLNNQKLYYKMLFIVIGACMLLLLGFGGVMHIICNAYNNLIYEKTAQVFVAYSEQMENRLDKLETVTLAIIGDIQVQEILTQLKVKENSVYEKAKLTQELTSRLESHIYDATEWGNIFVFMPQYEGDYKGNVPVWLTVEETASLVNIADENAGAMEIVACGNKVYLVRQIRERLKLTLADLGTIIGEINIQNIMKESGMAYEDTGNTSSAGIYVEGECIYSEGEYFSPMKQDGWKIENGYFVAQYTSRRGWLYLFHTPYSQIMETIRTTTLTTGILAGVILLFVLFVSRFFIGRTLRQLDELVYRFEDYANGLLPTEEEMLIYKDRKDEIGYLNRQFEQMVYAHKKLEDENYQRMVLHKEAQYKQLQHQIRPHFIFNTLSMISWTAYRNHDTETVTLTKALSELLRGSMSTNEETVGLEWEMKLVEHYMHILHTRYKGRIDFKMEIPEEMLEIQIPYMTLQPIIENAVNYGLEDDLDICTIRVRGKIENDRAVLIVEDNGPGVAPDILEQLASGQKKPNGNGVGLLNVQQRIQMVFSEEYGLSFHREGKCTLVQIDLPVVERVQEAEQQSEE